MGHKLSQSPAGIRPRIPATPWQTGARKRAARRSASRRSRRRSTSAPASRDRGGKRNPGCKAVLAGLRPGRALHRPARRPPGHPGLRRGIPRRPGQPRSVHRHV